MLPFDNCIYKPCPFHLCRDKKPVKPVIYHSWVEQICREAFSSDTSFTVKLVSAKVLSQNLTVTDILPTGVVAETSQSKCTVSEENNIQVGFKSGID